MFINLGAWYKYSLLIFDIEYNIEDTYFLTYWYLLPGHLLRVELSAGEPALPLSPPGQGQHHQSEKQPVKISLN